MSLNESHIEGATLEWLGELGYGIGQGPDMAPGEAAAERDSFSDVVLKARLRGSIPPFSREEVREEVLRKVPRSFSSYPRRS